MDTNVATRRILLIEDDENISGPLKWALESRNYKVVIINNGATAINTIETLMKDSFSLILLDLMLPGANGWEILIKLRSNPNTAKVPVIMLTAIDDEVSEARALYDGADDYITKPFSMNVLLAHIDANLRKQTTSIIQEIDLHFTEGDFEPLSKKEKQVLGYVVKGYSNKEIASLLSINEITVGNHLTKIFKKLNVSSRTQAAIAALKYELVSIG